MAFSDRDISELASMIASLDGNKCQRCLACAGKTSSGARFQDVLGMFRVVVDPRADGIELWNADGSLAARVKL